MTPLAWILLALTLAFAVAGVVTGSSTLVIIAILIIVFAVLLALAVPRNVHDLDIPPGMPNVPDDFDTHDQDR